MTNRQKVIAAIKSTATERVKGEIEYYMDTYSEFAGYDEADALNDALTLAEDNGDKSVSRDCINVLIAAGYYTPRSCMDTVVTMGRDRAPVRKGRRYDCVEAWCLWIAR
jgi:hypothetical protein